MATGIVKRDGEFVLDQPGQSILKTEDTCHRCGHQHLQGFVWLELNCRTNEYSKPGTVPPEESQGLFRFGRACAKRQLKGGR